MIHQDFYIELANWGKDFAALHSVREQVFVIEQQVRIEEEQDEFDVTSLHVLAFDQAGNPIGTARLTPEHKIGRMAVLKEWRNRGVGAGLLRTLLEYAQAKSFPSIELHAQMSAIGFYEKFGFIGYGEEFIEANIPHRRMRLELAPTEIPSQKNAIDSQPSSEKWQSIVSSEQASIAMLEIIQLAKRELCIYTRDLDAALLDTEKSVEALKQLALSGRGVRIRILVQNPLMAIQSGHRLISSIERLPTAFAVRIPTQEEDFQYPSAFILNDQNGFYFRPLGNRFEGESHTYAPARHKQLWEYFEQVWQFSEPSVELRHLSI